MIFNLPFFRKKTKSIKPTVLVILDGFGLAPHSSGNAATLAKMPNWHRYLKTYPHTELIASGESVGLPANEVGNTEVGHLILGAGRVILQDLKRINLAIEKGTFFENNSFVAAAAHVRKNKSKLHIMGLLSSGNVHSSLAHLYALLQLAKKEDIEDVYLHLFTDGRDSPPKQAIEMVEKLENHLQLIRLGKIASVCGRYYAMDRDRRWDRTARAYKGIVQGLAIQTFSAADAVKGAYLRGQTDEFIEPTVIADRRGPLAMVNDNDAVIFFNFRIDRPRQLTMAFVLPNFENLQSFDFGYESDIYKTETEVKFNKTFDRGKKPANLFFVTMTEYHKNLPVSAVAFSPEVVKRPIGQIISEGGFKQLHMAESEKDRFVNYYFNGLKEEKFDGEDRSVINSPKIPTYDKKPEMSLPKLVDEFKRYLSKDFYHFVVINFANPDMVAHTGNLEATIQALEIVDKYLAILVEEVLASGGSVIITADHGNAEELLSYPATTYFFTTSKGTINTDHSNNPVPVAIISERFEGNSSFLPKGALSDVSPTILYLMGISKPLEMTGRNLLEIISNKQEISNSELTGKPVT